MLLACNWHFFGLFNVYLWNYCSLSGKGDVGLDRNLALDFKQLSQESILSLPKCHSLAKKLSLLSDWAIALQVTPGSQLCWEVKMNIAYSALFLGCNYDTASKTQWYSIYSFLFIHSELVFGLKIEVLMIEMQLTS